LFEVFLGVGAGFYLAGHALYYLNSGAFECFDFIGIVRQQADARDAQLFQHFGGRVKSRWSALKPRPFVGFKGIEPRILQRIGLQLAIRPNAAAFLLLVNQDARTLLRIGERQFIGVVRHLIYEQQEGRASLMAKLQAYSLQDSGLIPWKANERLGFKADHRDFTLPAEMLKKLGVTRVRLLSNQSR